MILECSHSAHHTFVIEVRESPLDGFFDVSATGMRDLAQMFQNWLRKVGRLRDVRINARIFFWHNYFSATVGFETEAIPSSRRFLQTMIAPIVIVTTRPIPNSSIMYFVGPVSRVMGVRTLWMIRL